MTQWKPKLTPAKLRALRLVVECSDPAGYKAKGTVLTSCSDLIIMGLVDLIGGRYSTRHKATRAGKRALANPDRYKPVDPWESGGIARLEAQWHAADHTTPKGEREP